MSATTFPFNAAYWTANCTSSCKRVSLLDFLRIGDAIWLIVFDGFFFFSAFAAALAAAFSSFLAFFASLSCFCFALKGYLFFCSFLSFHRKMRRSSFTFCGIILSSNLLTDDWSSGCNNMESREPADGMVLLSLALERIRTHFLTFLSFMQRGLR